MDKERGLVSGLQAQPDMILFRVFEALLDLDARAPMSVSQMGENKSGRCCQNELSRRKSA